MVKNPCKRNCEKRSATCHAECEAYLAYAAEKVAEYEARRTENEKDVPTADGKRRAKNAERLKRLGRMK